MQPKKTHFSVHATQKNGSEEREEGGKEEQNETLVEQIDETSDSQGTNTSVRSGVLWCARSVEECSREQEFVRIFDLSKYKSNGYMAGERSHADINVSSYDVERHAKTCVERYCELANQKIEQMCKVFHTMSG